MVMFAIVNRIDSTLQALVGEVRAMHSQYSRFDVRLRKLEGVPD